MQQLVATTNRVVGMKQVLRAILAGKLAHVYLANDADTFIFQRVRIAAEDAGIPITRVDTMKELGKACKIAIDCAAAGILR